MNNLKITFLGLIFLSLFSCSPQLNYLGNNYAPTQQVDVFFDENDIEKDFRVMGMLKNEGSLIELDDTESIQNAMVKKAKSLGADAILFEGFYTKENRGEHTRINKKNKNTTTVQTHNESSKIYEVKLIKYKD